MWRNTPYTLQARCGGFKRLPPHSADPFFKHGGSGSREERREEREERTEKREARREKREREKRDA